MINNGLEYDPIDYYKGVLRQEFKDNAQEFFQGIAKESKVDKEENLVLAKEVRKQKALMDGAKKNYKFAKAWKNFFLVLGILGIIAFFAGFIVYFGMEIEILGLLLGLTIGGVALAVTGFCVAFIVFNKKVKEYATAHDGYAKKYTEVYNKASAQLIPLKELFNFKNFIKVVNKTNGGFTIDEELKQEKLLMMANNYDYKIGFRDDTTVLDVISGNIEKNPFIRVLLYNKRMYNHTYTGTLTISWNVTYTDSEGHVRTRVESETLVAHYTAPAPRYYNEGVLIYGNEAAPDLSFSRAPSGLKIDHTEKDAKKLAEKRYKEMEDIAEKMISKGRSLQPITNPMFEGLFYSLNRDHEAQYRLLFTPLAQQNMIELMTNTEFYGDDFYLRKAKKLNYVYTQHATFSITFRYTSFYQYYDYNMLEKDYLEAMCEAYQSLYFDLCPLLAIPLYQMSEPSVFDPVEHFQNVSGYEAESFINHMDSDLFKHKDTDTQQILKAKYVNSVGKSDVYEVTSYSFQKIKHIEYIQKMGGDGCLHNVPVVWYEYIPLTQINNVVIAKIEDSDDKKDENYNSGLELTRYKNFAGRFLGEDTLDSSSNDEFVKAIRNRYNFIK